MLYEGLGYFVLLSGKYFDLGFCEYVLIDINFSCKCLKYDYVSES